MMSSLMSETGVASLDFLRLLRTSEIEEEREFGFVSLKLYLFCRRSLRFLKWVFYILNIIEIIRYQKRSNYQSS